MTHIPAPATAVAQPTRYDRWSRLTEWPLIVLSLVFATAYAWMVLAELRGPGRHLAEAVINATWVAFAVDYLVRLTLAEQRRRWFVRHLFSLVVIALPVLRPLRLVRLLTLLTVFHKAAGSALRGRVVVYASSFTGLVLFIGALGVLAVERHHPGATITSFGTALWWAVVTLTTVGYGDYTPVTTEGRLIAVGLMGCGIALLGTVTATFASWLVQQVALEDDNRQAATRRQVDELAAQVGRLEQLLLELRAGQRAGAPTGSSANP